VPATPWPPVRALPDGLGGALSLRINEPDLPWPPFPEQADRFLAKVVGLAPRAAEK
jgi:hypothetical protein